MHIITLIKQVPNTTDIKIDPKTGNLIREGVESIMNPDDRHAVEAAVQIKERYGASITVISMGPPQAIDVITEAIGMGADKGILLTDQAFAGADTWATSYTLGKAIQQVQKFDLILCGRQAIDGDTAQIGPQVAEFLGINQVTYVSDIQEITPASAIVCRKLEDGYERLECPLPALWTVIKEINMPRYPDIARLIWACNDKAPIQIWNAADIGVKTFDVGLEGSLTQVIRTFSPTFKRDGEILKGDVPDMVKQLLEKIKKSDGAPACKAFTASCRL